MRFSLILATVDRVFELERFLKSMLVQSCVDCELIVVDQNQDDLLCELLDFYRDKIDIRHLRCDRGLSKARNMGLAIATGDIVAFPDDDCVYEVGLLACVDAFFVEHPEIDGLTGKVVALGSFATLGRFDKSQGFITKMNVWRRGASISIFLRQDVVKTVGGFDETIGAGSGTPWGSGEETDYLIRAIECGKTLWYDPDLFVRHPAMKDIPSEAMIKRGLSYGRGAGRLLGTYGYPAWFCAAWLIRPLGGLVLNCLKGQMLMAKYHYNVFVGRIDGLMSSWGMN